MGKAQWVIWSVFFALLANVSNGFGLAPASPAPGDIANPQNVCQAQASIASVLAAAEHTSHPLAICQVQEVLDGASSVPVPERQQSLDTPAPAALLAQRSTSLPEELPALVQVTLVDAELPVAAPAPHAFSRQDSRSGPPEPRYLFLLTPHAPPARA